MVNNVLKEKNYRVLPCPVNTSSTTDTQTNLEARMQIIKREEFAAAAIIKDDKIEDDSEMMASSKTHDGETMGDISKLSKPIEAAPLMIFLVKSEPDDQA